MEQIRVKKMSILDKKNSRFLQTIINSPPFHFHFSVILKAEGMKSFGAPMMGEMGLRQKSFVLPQRSTQKHRLERSRLNIDENNEIFLRWCNFIYTV